MSPAEKLKFTNLCMDVSSGVYTKNEVDMLVVSIKRFWERANRLALNSFNIGDQVHFDGGPRRGIINGKVVDIKVKFVYVQPNFGPRYKVAPNLLQKVGA